MDNNHEENKDCAVFYGECCNKDESVCGNCMTSKEMTNNKITDGRSRLREAAKNYQTALAWYQSNIDSPAALQTWDAATAEFMAAIGNRETDIIADLLDEIDELQERRK